MTGCRLDYSAHGTCEHLAWCKCFELALQFDQLNVCALACMELGSRRIQMCHEKWKGKLPSLGALAGGGIDDDTYLLLGTSETRGNLGVCPALQTWIGEELHREATSAKERRKAREERALAAKK